MRIRLKDILLYFVYLSILLTLTITFWPEQRATEPEGWDRNRIIRSQSALSTIRSPSSITVCLVEPKPKDLRGTNQLAEPSYRVVAGPLEVDSDVSEKIAGEFSSIGKQYKLTAISCMPAYDLRFDFTKDSSSVRVYLCTETTIFAVYEQGRWVGGHHEGILIQPWARRLIEVLRIEDKNSKNVLMPADNSIIN